ncbi:MAG: hypothetical protein AB1941_06165 [Gemmatimonadota bacterium]
MEHGGLDLLDADGIVVWHRELAPAAARINFAVIPDQQGPRNGRSP